MRLRLQEALLRSQKIWNDDGRWTGDIPLTNRVVAELLSVNYRVSDDPRQEVAILDLITTENFNNVIRAALDDPAKDELIEALTSNDEKKKEAQGVDVQGVGAWAAA